MHVLGLNWKLKDADNHAFENGRAKPVTFPTNTVTAISADGNILKIVHFRKMFSFNCPTKHIQLQRWAAFFSLKGYGEGGQEMIELLSVFTTMTQWP